MRMKVLSCELLFYASSAFVGEFSKLRGQVMKTSAEPRDFATLSYRELQAEAKRRNLCAVGSTSVLRNRLAESSTNIVASDSSAGSEVTVPEVCAISPSVDHLPKYGVAEGWRFSFKCTESDHRIPFPTPSLKSSCKNKNYARFHQNASRFHYDRR